MGSDFTVTDAGVMDGPLVLAGPKMETLSQQLLVPSSLIRKVTYGATLPTLELSLVFSGERIEIVKMTVKAEEGYVSTQFLTHLALPRVIRQAALESIPHSARWLENSADRGQGIESYDFLAQIYWLEHLSWGSPRNSVMSFMGWSRANTNFHLRKMADMGLLPKRQKTSAQ